MSKRNKFDFAYDFKNHYARVVKNNMYGLIDVNGESIIKCEYDFLSDVVEGKLIGRKDKSYKLLDVDGSTFNDTEFTTLENAINYLDEITSDHFSELSKGDVPISVDGKYRFNFKGTKIKRLYDFAFSFRNKVSRVKKNNEYFFVNEFGKDLNIRSNLALIFSLHNYVFDVTGLEQLETMNDFKKREDFSLGLNVLLSLLKLQLDDFSVEKLHHIYDCNKQLFDIYFTNINNILNSLRDLEFESLKQGGSANVFRESIKGIDSEIRVLVHKFEVYRERYKVFSSLYKIREYFADDVVKYIDENDVSIIHEYVKNGFYKKEDLLALEEIISGYVINRS